ncbi:hypothetical protein PRIPAC_77425 [Pristionchus pacificus]|uniref:Uncharacterized protein n=1 Tax=Pristionchus pacificus TaxID=54126 RepID=A0A2A6CNF9_PRIPA|nr:hypothetical protein PRIPAC_77425 [Pristionchus pacificus]|eukprot:PDM79734.1 hypothetical protein PRIPAC_32313 [Pristionchus pacificus]
MLTSPPVLRNAAQKLRPTSSLNIKEPYRQHTASLLSLLFYNPFYSTSSTMEQTIMFGYAAFMALLVLATLGLSIGNLIIILEVRDREYPTFNCSSLLE